MNQRRSNIELLRLLSIVLIIGHHFAVHGGFYFTGGPVTGNMLALQLLSIGGKVGVNLFVLITGYFTSASRFSRAKALGIWKQMAVYSLLIYAAGYLAGLTAPSAPGLLGAALPVTTNQWWFGSTWMLLYLLSPALNRGLGKLGRKGFAGLLAGLAVFWYLVPVLAWLPGRLRELAWMVSLYCLGACLRRFGKTDRALLWLSLGLAAMAGAFFLGWGSMLGWAAAGHRYETAYFDAHHILMLLAGLGLFRGMLAVDLGVRPAINQLASHGFGIYLLHDSNLFRYPLWQGLLKAGEFAGSPWLLPYALGCIAAVFLVSLSLDVLLGRTLLSFLDKGKGR